MIYFYRDETVLSEFPSTSNRSLEGRACQWLPEAPAALGSVRSASWVWGRSSPRDAHARSLIHSFIHSFPPLRVGLRARSGASAVGSMVSARPHQLQSGGSGRPVPRCPRPFSEHGQPSGRDRGQVVLSWPAVPRRGQGRRRPRDLCRLPRSSGLPPRRGLCQGQEQNEEHSCPDFRVRGSRARPAGSVRLGSDWSPL